MKLTVMHKCMSFILVSIFNMAFAQPIVSNVVVSENNNVPDRLSITGRYFGTGPEVVIFDNFNSSTVGSPVDVNSPIYGTWNGNENNGIAEVGYDGDVGYSIYGFSPDGKPILSKLVAVFPRHVSDVLIAYSVTTPTGHTFSGASSFGTFPDVSSWKFTWLMDGSDGFYDNNGQADMCIPTHVGNGSMMIGGNEGGLTYIANGNTWWDFNRPNHLVSYIDVNEEDPKIQNGEIFFQATSKANGMYKFFKSDIPTAPPESNTNTYDRITFPGWAGNGDRSKFDAIYDDIYVAIGENFKARVELTDNIIHKDSTYTVVLPYDVWTDTKIEIDVGRLGITDIEKLFVHIIDSDGTKSVEGFPICSLCPKPPILN